VYPTIGVVIHKNFARIQAELDHGFEIVEIRTDIKDKIAINHLTTNSLSSYHHYHIVNRLQNSGYTRNDEGKFGFTNVNECLFDLFDINSAMTSLRATSVWQLNSQRTITDRSWNMKHTCSSKRPSSEDTHSTGF